MAFAAPLAGRQDDLAARHTARGQERAYVLAFASVAIHPMQHMRGHVTVLLWHAALFYSQIR